MSLPTKPVKDTGVKNIDAHILEKQLQLEQKIALFKKTKKKMLTSLAKHSKSPIVFVPKDEIAGTKIVREKTYIQQLCYHIRQYKHSVVPTLKYALNHITKPEEDTTPWPDDAAIKESVSVRRKLTRDVNALLRVVLLKHRILNPHLHDIMEYNIVYNVPAKGTALQIVASRLDEQDFNELDEKEEMLNFIADMFGDDAEYMKKQIVSEFEQACDNASGSRADALLMNNTITDEPMNDVITLNVKKVRVRNDPITYRPLPDAGTITITKRAAGPEQYNEDGELIDTTETIVQLDYTAINLPMPQMDITLDYRLNFQTDYQTVVLQQQKQLDTLALWLCRMMYAEELTQYKLPKLGDKFEDLPGFTPWNGIAAQNCNGTLKIFNTSTGTEILKDEEYVAVVREATKEEEDALLLLASGT